MANAWQRLARTGRLPCAQADTGKVLSTLSQKGGWSSSLVFSPDGKRLAAAGPDGTVKVWEAETGKVLCTVAEEQGWITFVAFSPDGKRLATGDKERRTVRLWDSAGGKMLSTLPRVSGPLAAVGFDADGKQVLAVVAGTRKPGELALAITAWEVEGGKEVRSLKVPEPVVLVSALRPDGRQLVTSGAEGVLRLWDAVTAAEIRPGTGHRARFAPLPCGRTAVCWPRGMATGCSRYGTWPPESSCCRGWPTPAEYAG